MVGRPPRDSQNKIRDRGRKVPHHPGIARWCREPWHIDVVAPRVAGQASSSRSNPETKVGMSRLEDGQACAFVIARSCARAAAKGVNTPAQSSTARHVRTGSIFVISVGLEGPTAGLVATATSVISGALNER